LSYQWSKGGNAIIGATTATLTLLNISAADAGTYTVAVTNLAGSVTSSGATLTLISPPTITSQPASVTNASGTTAGFTVNAGGTAPLSYQWFQASSPLAGATGSTLIIPNVSSANAGNYTVTISNAAGSITSGAATLTVLDLPTITGQPQSSVNTAGETVSFTVTANGTGPLSYQWSKDGSVILGATAATLTLPNVSADNSGTYAVTITNLAGSVTSSGAILTVITLPTITIQPASVTNVAGTTASFNVGASGTAPLSYQWFKASSPLAGATSSTLTLTNVSSADVGSYTVTIHNSAGTVTSAVATLTVTDASPITIVSNPKKGPSDPFKIKFKPNVNRSYDIQASSDLVHWRTVSTTNSMTGTIVEFVDPASGLDGSFYRLVEH
jgi:hypothetical protein